MRPESHLQNRLNLIKQEISYLKSLLVTNLINKFNKSMFPIIDFRNGRYQGQTKNHLPHGIGFFIDKNYMLVISEWLAGDIKGYSIIIYPSGRIFCGKIGYKRIEQLCSFQLTQDHVQLISVASVRNENDIQKIAAILPLLKIIL